MFIEALAAFGIATVTVGALEYRRRWIKRRVETVGGVALAVGYIIGGRKALRLTAEDVETLRAAAVEIERELRRRGPSIQEYARRCIEKANAERELLDRAAVKQEESNKTG